MTAPTKDAWNKWLPTVVAIIGCGAQLAYVAHWMGAAEQKILAAHAHAVDQSLHMPLDKKLEVFITRREADQRGVQRDREMATLRTMMEEQGRKLDIVIAAVAKRGANE